MTTGQLKTADQAETANHQHTTPCKDCPWTRCSLPGWLAGEPPGWWLSVAHGESLMQCHTRKNTKGVPHQCAGAAIYRRNVCKMVMPHNLTLPRDAVTVFASPSEFAGHHLRRKVLPAELLHMRQQGLARLAQTQKQSE